MDRVIIIHEEFSSKKRTERRIHITGPIGRKDKYVRKYNAA
jgi:hypothetical protein